MDDSIYDCDDGYPIVDMDSDDDCKAESSEDELDVILHGTPEQKRRLFEQTVQRVSEPEEEEQDLEPDTGSNKREHQQTGSGDKSEAKEDIPQFYDENYFDSDSDDEGTRAEKATRKHPVLSNDELLYDPDIDNDNQRWVDRQRRKYQPKPGPGERTANQIGRQNKTGVTKLKPLPNSDAVLNCPACMSLLCLDCQRHSTYKHQYRAMFVRNCKVEHQEILKFPKEGPKQKGKKSKKQKKKNKSSTNIPESDTIPTSSDSVTMDNIDTGNRGNTSPTATQQACINLTDGTDLDVFNPVRCQICTTEVGVYDRDEVYHFFNVLASHG